jgi:5-methylthioadenosine/S-adenosylhomocysteine deaminase
MVPMNRPEVTQGVQAQGAPRSRPYCDLLLRGGHVITVDDDGRVLDSGSVAISGDRIVAVGTDAELEGWTAARVVDCRNRAVIPGLVDCHNHLFQALVRGLGEGLSIWPWLREFMWPYAIAISADEARAAVSLGVVEALRAGTTTVIDHHYAPTDVGTVLAVAEIIETSGLRGVVARGILGRKTAVAENRGLPDEMYRYSTRDELSMTRECMQERPVGSKVTVWPGPLNLAYLDQGLFRSSVDLARQCESKWHTHCSEGKGDPTSYLDAYGVRPVAWLRSEGLLDERATLAHAIWLDAEEIYAIGNAGAGVAHNPVSNGYMASGRMPLRELQESGAVIGLGTDGPSAGHRQDLFESMKYALFMQRLGTLDPTEMRCEQALEMATRHGARVAGVDAGVLATGKLADVAVVRLDAPHLRPLNSPVATVVYSALSSDVDMTICGGKIVVENGRCTLVDEEKAIADAEAASDRLLARSGIGALRTKH